jgi:hypothetical protein
VQNLSVDLDTELRWKGEECHFRACSDDKIRKRDMRDAFDVDGVESECIFCSMEEKGILTCVVRTRQQQQQVKVAIASLAASGNCCCGRLDSR